MRRLSGHALPCLLAVALSTPALAEETIYDPENPATPQRVEPDEAESEETILDPENPAVSSHEGDEEDDDSFFGGATFAGGYATMLSVDRSFDGGGEDIVELGNGFDLRIDYAASPRLDVVLEGQFRHWTGGKRNPEETDVLLNVTRVRAAYDARPGEAYLTYRGDAFSVAFGNMITRWGSTDLVRPGDVLNPVDQTSLDPTSAAEKIPQLTLEATWFAGDWSLTGLLVPFFVEDRIWIFGRDTSLLNPDNPVVADQFPVHDLLERVIDPSVQDDVQPLARATRRPDEVPANLSVGGRAAGTVWNTDLGLGYFYGWDRTPFIFADDDLRTLITTVLEDGQVLEDLDLVAFLGRHRELLEVTDRLTQKAVAGEDLFFSEYRRLHTALFDVARYVGPIGVRADVAFHPQKTYYTESFRAVRRPTLTPALGLSWERIRDDDDVFTATLEGFWLRPFEADDPLTQTFVADEDRGDPGDPLLIVDGGNPGLAAAVVVQAPWSQGVRLQVGGLADLSHGSFIATANVSKRFYTWLRAQIAYVEFHGPSPEDELSYGGLYRDDDYLSVGLDGSF